VLAADEDEGRVALDRTAFYPGGGGQPHDVGELVWDAGRAAVTRVKRDGPLIWHWLGDPGGAGLPDSAAGVQGILDWERRHSLMRTHTALHVLCGVIWADFGVAVTGGGSRRATPNGNSTRRHPPTTKRHKRSCNTLMSLRKKKKRKYGK
jgi:misacylated tRNA(Ala) deacylase